MRLKRIMLLSSLALATAALAAPAAQAEEWVWTHNGAPLQGHAASSFEGNVQFASSPPGSSFGCDVTVTLTAEEGSTGTITTFNPTTATCKATKFGVCEVKADAAPGLPWTVHLTSETNFVITNATVNFEFKPGCGLGEAFNLIYPSLLVKADTPAAIKTLTLSGIATSGLIVVGELPVEAAGATLGIEEVP